MLALTVQRFATAVLIDCHSMPSFGGPMDRDPGTERADMVLGDRFGTSCAKVVTDTVENVLTRAGFRVERNDPYAGGFTTRNYGRPDSGVHALQIEIKRSLYMDEDTMERLPALETVTETMNNLIAALASIDHAQLL